LPERSRNATTGTNHRAEITNSPIQPCDSVVSPELPRDGRAMEGEGELVDGSERAT
jgi:hypothetical protein